jgi:hypothetical protein
MIADRAAFRTRSVGRLMLIALALSLCGGGAPADADASTRWSAGLASHLVSPAPGVVPLVTRTPAEKSGFSQVAAVLPLYASALSALLALGSRLRASAGSHQLVRPIRTLERAPPHPLLA